MTPHLHPQKTLFERSLTNTTYRAYAYQRIASSRTSHTRHNTPLLAPAAGGAAQDTLYDKLGVAPDASAAALRKAYLQLVVTMHPDKGGCPERFFALQQAYSLLSDPAQRAAYDDRLAGASGGHPAAAFPAGAKVVRSRNGVTAVVHGQTGPSTQQQQEQQEQAGGRQCCAAAAGAAEVTARINALLQQQQQQQRGGSMQAGCGVPAAAPQLPPQHGIAEALAELYLERARVHLSHGRLHHAHFDAQEAAGLCPEWEAGRRLLQELGAALQEMEAGGGEKGSLGGTPGLEDSSSEEEGD